MKFKNFISVFFILLFILGCQAEVAEESTIEIVNEGKVIGGIDEEFDDGLDDALNDLKEIENI
jgi:hypothetical protein